MRMAEYPFKVKRLLAVDTRMTSENGYNVSYDGRWNLLFAPWADLLELKSSLTSILGRERRE